MKSTDGRFGVPTEPMLTRRWYETSIPVRRRIIHYCSSQPWMNLFTFLVMMVFTEEKHGLPTALPVEQTCYWTLSPGRMVPFQNHFPLSTITCFIFALQENYGRLMEPCFILRLRRTQNHLVTWFSWMNGSITWGFQKTTEWNCLKLN